MVKIMNLGEFRALTHHLSDDADLLMDEGDLRFAEVRIHAILPQVDTKFPPAVLLEMGQVWNHELDLNARIDKQLEI